MPAHKQTVNDGEGNALNDLVFPEGPFTAVTALSAGTGSLQVCCDPADDIRADPLSADLKWAELAALSGTGAQVNSLAAPVTAVRVLPVGGTCELRVAY